MTFIEDAYWLLSHFSTYISGVPAISSSSVDGVVIRHSTSADNKVANMSSNPSH